MRHSFKRPEWPPTSSAPYAARFQLSDDEKKIPVRNHYYMIFYLFLCNTPSGADHPLRKTVERTITKLFLYSVIFRVFDTGLFIRSIKAIYRRFDVFHFREDR